MDDLRPGLGGILGLMDHDHHHHHLHHHHPTAVHPDKQRVSKGTAGGGGGGGGDSSNELGSLYGLPVNAAGDSSHHNTPSPGRGSLAEQTAGTLKTRWAEIKTGLNITTERRTAQRR